VKSLFLVWFISIWVLANCTIIFHERHTHCTRVSILSSYVADDFSCASPYTYVYGGKTSYREENDLLLFDCCGTRRTDVEGL
jgi:hypothetical protein